MIKLTKKPLFNPQGDTEVRLRRMIGGNTTNLNDFTQMRYTWVSDWYRQAMNNFWIPGGNQPFPGQKRIIRDFPKKSGRLMTRFSVSWCFWIPYSPPTCPVSVNM